MLKSLRETITKEISKQFNQLRKEAYKLLWNDDSEQMCGFNIQDGGFMVHIHGDSISFDGKKTFINRREEHQIVSEFDKLEQKVIDFYIEEVKSLKEKSKTSSEIPNKINNLKKRAESSALMSALSEITIIDEQIDILREINGDKNKLFDLLEEKRKLLSSLREFTESVNEFI